MKRMLLLILLSMRITAQEPSLIIPYDSCYEDEVISIAFENALDFFCGSVLIDKGILSEQQFLNEAHLEIRRALRDPHNVTYILLVDKKVAGFIEFNKIREQSIENIMKMLDDRAIPYDASQLAQELPQLKQFDHECKDYIFIECLAVSQNFRGKGFEKMLLDYSITTSSRMWPSIEQIRIKTNESNIRAQSLYESTGFTRIPDQFSLWTEMGIIEYQKNLY